MASVLLATAAIVVFLLSDWEYLADNAPSWLEDIKWFIPLLVGVVMSSIVVYLKWEPFFADKGEPHFIASFIALLVPLGMIVLIIVNSLGYLDVGTGRWIYPISFIGISISLISIAMIWEGMRRRKTIAIISALIPLTIMITPAFFESADTILEILPLVYLGSAVCIQLSGSMLHLLSTATSVQEREILKGSDAKLTALRDELNIKEERIEFKESALRVREIEAEAFEKSLNDRKLDLEHRLDHVEKIEKELAKKEERYLAERKRIASAEFEFSVREEKIEQREMERVAREREQENLRKTIEQKEKQLKEEESKLQREQAQFELSKKQFNEREEHLKNELQKLESGKERLIDEKNQLAEKAKELQMKESSLDMKLRSAESSVITSSKDIEQMERFNKWEEELLEKEQEISAAKTELTRKKSMAEELAEQAERKLSSTDEKSASIEAKENELQEKEDLMRKLERDFSDRKMKLQEKVTELEDARDRIGSMKEKYDYFLERLRNRGEELAKKDELVERRMSALDAREEKVKALQERLKNEIAQIEKRRRELIELDKSMSTKSSKLQIRELELKERRKHMEQMLHSGVITPEATGGMLEELRERERVLSLREKKLAEKERELRTRAYEIGRPRGEEIEEEMIEVSASSKPEKVGTGTKRLDDLLFGGLPFGSSLLLVGPPFSGKEVAILSFIADGLKRGIPTILVTTSKTPNDLVKDFAPILPTFLETEDLGLVRWIDATAGEGLQKKTIRPRKNIIRADGPDDFPGIIEAIEKFTEDVRKGKHPYFKLGYLSLSTSISHAAEMEGTKFIQAMVGNIRELGSSGMFALEKGMHSEQQIESIQHLMDGALLIKLEKQKTYLSIIGVGEAQTREWVEFNHSMKGLIIGAFSLERIR